MRNTMRNVTMVVPVLMMSCHVSEKPKNGPLSAQATITSTQTTKVSGRPVACATVAANTAKTFDIGICLPGVVRETSSIFVAATTLAAAGGQLVVWKVNRLGRSFPSYMLVR